MDPGLIYTIGEREDIKYKASLKGCEKDYFSCTTS